jgi:hypothetical protein
MGILLDGFWMLHHDIGMGAKKDAVLLALTLLWSFVTRLTQILEMAT